MRITYITHYAELYGANRSLLDLLLELRRTGDVEPHVLLPAEGPLTDALRNEAVPHRVFPFQPWMSERRYEGRLHHRIGQYWGFRKAARARMRANEALLPAIQDQVKAWRTQLVHANSAAVSIGGDLASDAALPFVWHIREMPEAHYGLHMDRGRTDYGRALREADRVIAISHAVEADVLRYATPPRPPVVIYNGVLHQVRYAALRRDADKRWEAAGPFVLVMVGLIHPSKGQVEAVDSLRLVREAGHEVRLVIVGQGKDEHLRKHIADTGMQEHVELTGFLEDPFPRLMDAHALLMCSRHEAMGRTTVEAMACGLPVIGHASGGTPEIVTHGEDGLLYTDGARELAKRIIQLATDRVLARALGRCGAVHAEARFSVERYAAEVHDVYRTVLSER